MAKTDILLRVFKQHIGEWVCGYCNSGSNQPAATFRGIKMQGYKFEEVLPNRWAKNIYCTKCGDKRTHYKLLSPEPEFQVKSRITTDKGQRKRILELLGGKDAFTGASITSTPEIDHKIPWSRLGNDINASDLTDNQIFEHFQLLTREHNLLKDRACGECKKTGKRPPFLEIKFWYSGDYAYTGSCEGCGWYDGIRWRSELNAKI